MGVFETVSIVFTAAFILLNLYFEYRPRIEVVSSGDRYKVYLWYDVPDSYIDGAGKKVRKLLFEI